MNKLLVTLAVGSLSVLTSANAADVLFVTGSPDLEKSNASRVITQLVQEKVPGVEIVRTDKIKLNSPEDIERERNRVSNAKNYCLPLSCLLVPAACCLQELSGQRLHFRICTQC